MATMRAIVAEGVGVPEVLRMVERAIPTPGHDEVLIKVGAAGVNRPDIMQRIGAIPVPPGATDIFGLEAAGEVVEGAGELLGRRVMALLPGGGYADYAVAKAAHCLPMPDHMTFVEGAALPEALFTVWHNLFDRARLAPGETVLVHGAASGVGMIAVQTALACGARAIGTVGSDEKKAAIEKLGARAVNYRTTDFVQAVREMCGDASVDVVLDIVGGSYIARNFELLAYGGRHVSLSFMESAVVPVDFGVVMRKGLHLSSSTLRPRSADEKAAMAKGIVKHMLPLVQQGRVKPVVWRQLSLGDAAEAHRLLEANRNIGKVVLLPR